MNEVSGQTVELLLDTLRHRQLDIEVLWRGLAPIRRERIDWDTWVEVLARIEAKVGPTALEELFVAGGGERTGHRFMQLARGFLSVRDIYALFARWGLRRALMVCSGTFEQKGERHAEFTVEIDPMHVGSLPTLRFIAGILRSMPWLQRLPQTATRIRPDATPHRAIYELELPAERSLVARARRAARLFGGVGAALDELEQQATEIAAKNVALERQLESAREHDMWLALALDAGRVGTWRWDPATATVRVSSKLAEMLVMTTTDMPTSEWTARIHPDDRERVAAAVRGAMPTGAPFEIEYRVNLNVGEPRWLRVSGCFVEDRETHQQRVLGTAVDVTERRQLDEQLRLADRLIAAGTLAAGVAHEINNPLTYVLGNVELMQRRLRDQPATKALVDDSLAQMVDGLERIRDVVSDLRAFARPEEDVVGRLVLSTVCDAAIRLVSSVVRHRAEVVTEYAPNVPAVIANESRLGQIIINLIVNASHAMPERATSESRITVRTRTLANGDAAIEVEDNGTGIAPEILTRLFDPFFTTKQLGVGTGLGLSVCQSIVASLRGRIDVDTALGRGTIFTVVLPPAPPLPVIPSPPARQPSAVSGLRVLVVDDEPMVRRTLSRLLVSHGCQVTEADGGVAGLERAAGGAFDIVLCDLMMPDLDGALVHHELVRTRPELANRMVFISGGAVTERTREFAERPDITLIAKPFAVDQLLGALASAARR